MKLSTLKKHIAYISIDKPSLHRYESIRIHNLTKKQSLIPLNSTLFCFVWICKWMSFWIYIVSINVVKK